MSDDTRVLLISSSNLYGTGCLDHAESEIRDCLAGVGRVLFVPFALSDRAAYAERARRRLAAMGYALDSLHERPDMAGAVAGAEAVFVGGGNTFRLLKVLYDHDLLEVLRRRVAAGTPYVGSSAGANVAGPTIRTTRDMPIVEPPSFDALGNDADAHEREALTRVTERPIQPRQEAADGDDARGDADAGSERAARVHRPRVVRRHEAPARRRAVSSPRRKRPRSPPRRCRRLPP